MAESPEARGEGPEVPAPPAAPLPPPKPLAENAVLKFVQRPSILLILLAVWEIIGALTEFFTSSGLFVDLPGELDGALGGRALGWEQIPLAALYIYCARDPQRFRFVFWVALIEQAAAIVANIYHWGTDDFSGESVIIPVAVAAGLGALVFLHLFQPKPTEPAAPPSPAEAAGGG